jgi:hypothetical protein
MTRKYLQVLLGVAATALLASTASANLLVNPGFELPPTPAAPPEYFGATGWSDFGGGTFTINSTIIGTPAGAHSGDQVLKVFGGTSGVFQDFAAAPGQLWDAGAWALNDSFDPMAGGQIAAVNIEWHGGGGFISFVAGGTLSSASPLDVWTLLTASGIAPAGTTFARAVLITGDFAGPGGGAPKFDDAFFDIRPIPVPAAVWLFGSGLGLLGWMRRRSV